MINDVRVAGLRIGKKRALVSSLTKESPQFNENVKTNETNSK